MTEALKQNQYLIAQNLKLQGMRCNCDLDNWEPEVSTGHSHVCRIHKAAIAQPVQLENDDLTAAYLAGYHKGKEAQKVQLAELPQWKLGDEFRPYHPQASHINPDHRDGWNACYRAAQPVQPKEAK